MENPCDDNLVTFFSYVISTMQVHSQEFVMCEANARVWGRRLQRSSSFTIFHKNYAFLSISRQAQISALKYVLKIAENG